MKRASIIALLFTTSILTAFSNELTLVDSPDDNLPKAPSPSSGRRDLTQTGFAHISEQDHLALLVTKAMNAFNFYFTETLRYMDHQSLRNTLDELRGPLDQLELAMNDYLEARGGATERLIKFFKAHREEFKEIFKIIKPQMLFSEGTFATPQTLTADQKNLIAILIKEITRFRSQTNGKAKAFTQSLMGLIREFLIKLEEKSLFTQFGFRDLEIMDFYVNAWRALREAQKAINDAERMDPNYIAKLISDMKLESNNVGSVLVRRDESSSQNLIESMRRIQSNSEREPKNMNAGASSTTTTTTQPNFALPMPKEPPQSLGDGSTSIKPTTRSESPRKISNFNEVREMWESRATHQRPQQPKSKTLTTEDKRQLFKERGKQGRQDLSPHISPRSGQDEKMTKQ